MDGLPLGHKRLRTWGHKKSGPGVGQFSSQVLGGDGTRHSSTVLPWGLGGGSWYLGDSLLTEIMQQMKGWAKVRLCRPEGQTHKDWRTQLLLLPGTLRPDTELELCSLDPGGALCCRFLLRLLQLLHWQAGSWWLSHLGSPDPVTLLPKTLRVSHSSESQPRFLQYLTTPRTTSAPHSSPGAPAPPPCSAAGTPAYWLLLGHSRPASTLAPCTSCTFCLGKHHPGSSKILCDQLPVCLALWPVF